MDLDMTWTLMDMNYVTSLIINLCNRNVFNAGKHYKATPNWAGQRSLIQCNPLVAGGKLCSSSLLFGAVVSASTHLQCVSHVRQCCEVGYNQGVGTLVKM